MLAGRDREVAVVEAFLDRTAADARILLLQGEAGIGKTTLWRVSVAAAEERGFTVLSSTASEAETQLSFTLVRDLLDAVFDEVSDRLPPPQRQALAVVLFREEPPARALEPSAIALAFSRALQLLGQDRPLLVAIDDVQWLDPASATVLGYSLRRIGSSFFMLLARRPQASDMLELERLERPLLETVDVDGLSVGAIAHILKDELGVAYTRPTLHRLTDAAAGNPFFALELARAHDESSAPGAPLPIPPTLHELVTGRLAALPRETFELLVHAAAAARPVGTLPMHEPALRTRILVVHEGEVRFAHPLFAAAAYSLADPTLRRGVHARLAAEAGDVEERARHLALAAHSPDEHIAGTLEAAATRTRVRGDRVVAAALFQDAARLTPPRDAAGRARRLLAGAGALFEAGDSDAARMLLERVVADGATGDVAAEARWRLGTVLAETGSHDGPMELWEQALASVRDPQLAADIHRSIAVAEIYAGNGAAAVVHAERALAEAERSTSSEALAFALAARAYAAAVVGESYRSFVERSLERASALEIASSAWTPAAVAAECALLALDLERAEQGMMAVLDEAVATGNAEMELWAAHRVAAARLAAGNVRGAAELVPVILELAETTGVMQLPAARLDAEVAAHSGDVAGPLARLRDLVTESERQGWARHLWAARSALGAVHIGTGDSAEAAVQLELARGIAAESGIRSLTAIVPLIDEVEAAADAGLIAQARTALAAARSFADVPPVVEPLLLRAEAAVGIGEGDLQAAESLLAQAVEHDAAPKLPLHHARALLALGSVRRRLRRRRDARDALERARTAFIGLGSALWAARAEDELARIGGRAPSPEALTPSEKRIAMLVSEGKTNREVAAALVISPRTVESALSQIYRKLAVRSRTELTRKLTEPE